MLTRLKITGLFDTFDYDILMKEEGITLLTGPNGYGKSTILRMLYALSRKNPLFFFSLTFKEIAVEFKGQNAISIKKDAPDKLSITDGDSNFTLHKKELEKDIIKLVEASDVPIRPFKEGQWIDMRNEDILETDDIIDMFGLYTSSSELGRKHKRMPDVSDMYLIREQRLLQPLSLRRNRMRRPWDERFSTQYSETVKEYAKQLADLITKTLAESSQKSQEMDSTFPTRLFDQQTGIDEKTFNERFDAIKEKQRALSKFGLSAIQEGSQPTYKDENQNALLVYLDDTVKKLALFDDLREKLEAFTDILDERHFSHKRVQIQKDQGIVITADSGNNISLQSLSSGEKQEIVLFYELLFRAQPNTLVLIDEPEISLHVAWQKDFLNDLLRIIKLKNISVMAATHSPQIINTHWDLAVDLGELACAK